MKQEQFFEKVKAIIFGHAVGDAVGGPVQFEEREVRDCFPVTGMMPLGDPRFPKGAWSDDTSMSLCAMDALAKHGLDFRGVMENFKKWLFENEFTPTGVTFDVGRACFRSVEEFSRKAMTAEGHGRCGEHENGNGSLMRIYPFSLYLYCSDFPLDRLPISTARPRSPTRTREAVSAAEFILLYYGSFSKIPPSKGSKTG